MPRRKEHKIESNCVTFEDDCYNEQTSTDTYQTMYEDETKVIQNTINEVYRTGTDFVKYLENKLKKFI
jgi:hypothetical protein